MCWCAIKKLFTHSLTHRQTHRPTHGIGNRSIPRSLMFYYIDSERCANNNRFTTTVCPGLPRSSGTRRNIHPLTPIWSSTILYQLLNLLQSIASFLFNLCAWQSFCTISVQVFFSLPLGLAPSTSYSIHFFAQSLSFFTACAHTITTCSAVVLRLHHLILASLYLELLSFSLMPHIYLTILISACRSATSFSFLTGQVSLPCNILLHTQRLYNLPLTINDISLLVSCGTNCLNLFQLIRILASTAASASPFTLNMSPK